MFIGGKGLGILYSLMWIRMFKVRFVVLINVDRWLRVRVYVFTDVDRDVKG
jgi:hypothetical protein